LKVWLYSHLQNSPGNDLVLQEGKRRGHLISLIEPGSRHLDLLRGLNDPPDLVFTRVGSAAPESAIDYLTTIASFGIRCLNSPMGLRKSRHKGVAYGYLAQALVPIPKTVLVGCEKLEKTLEIIPGPPWILKLPLSTKGQGVCLVESLRSLRSVLDALGDPAQGVLLQEFVDFAPGSDTRVLVYGGKARIAARRQATEKDEFRSNMHLGGGAEQIELSPELAQIAETAAATLNLDIAGVDLIESERGFLVVEVNSSPGLTASKALPGLLFDYLEKTNQTGSVRSQN